MTTKLTPAQTAGLSTLKDYGTLVWETGNSTRVNKITLDALVKRGAATVETEGSFVSGQNRNGTWVKGYYHVLRTYRPA